MRGVFSARYITQKEFGMEDAVNGGRLSAAVQKLKQKKGKANGVSGVFTVIGCNVGLAALSLFCGVSAFFTPLFRGDWFTKLSYLFMGTGHFARGQKLKGTLYLLSGSKKMFL